MLLLLLYLSDVCFLLKVSAETSVATANVIDLSEVLSRFVLPSLPAGSVSHSLLLQLIHAVQKTELLPVAGNF